MFKNLLTTLFGLNVYFYGVFLVFCLFLFLFLFWRSIRKTSFSEERLVDALFVAGLVGLTFGRGLFFLLHPDYFAASALRFFLLFSFPGVSEFGFWTGFVLSFFVYSRRQKNKFRSLVELLALPIILVRFLFSLGEIALAPNLAQLILSLLLLVFLLAYFAFMRLAKKGRVQSTNVIYLVFGALISPFFIIDFFKPQRLYFFGQRILAVEQAFYGVVLLILLAVLIVNWLRGRKPNKKN